MWQALIATVQPLERKLSTPPADFPPKPKTHAVVALSPKRPKPAVAIVRPVTPTPRQHGNLDGHWDRRLTKGGVQPDVTIDLHDHGLASAHRRLDDALALSVAAGHRALLLVTGRERGHDRASGQGRGAIRAAVADWLAASRHARHIAAVRNAHPRHGGDGALYIILKKGR